MSDRIRALEEEVQKLHSQVSSADEPHPLLMPELLGIKSAMGLYSSAQSHTNEASSSPHSKHTESYQVRGARSPSEGMSPGHAHSVQVGTKNIFSAPSNFHSS